MNGIIIINKEKGYTSNDIVQIVKGIFKEKVGHTGTLDPLATGVLPLLIGKGTLCSKYLINHDKIYTATLKIGIKTDTGDITGNIVQRKDFSKEEIEFNRVSNALKKFVGEQEQNPPIYSAIKVNGKKLYEYARNNQKVDIPSRKITIYDLKLNSIKDDEINFTVCCSKGTYIRTLCEDIAESLNLVGTMSALNREKVGQFSIENAITIKELEENLKNSVFMEKYFMDLEQIFKDKQDIILTPRAFISFLNGAKLFTDENDGVYRIYDINKKFVGVGVVNKGILKRDIVVN